MSALAGRWRVLPDSRASAWRRGLLWIAAAALLSALAASAAHGLAPDERAHLVHYLLVLIAAVLGIGAPHALFPDPRVSWLQLANPSASRLLLRQAGRWLPLALLPAAPLVTVAAGAGAALAAQAVLAPLAVGLFALAQTVALGERMRAWRDGRAGGWYRALYRTAPPYRFAVPDELVPGLLATAEVFLAGAVVAVLGRASNLAPWGVLPALGLLGLAAARLAALGRTYDRAFYTTHGAWADAFHATAGPLAGRAPLAAEAVYWAPARLRPSVWAGLVSLDRRLPLGRAVAVGLAGVAAVEASGAAVGVRDAAILLLLAGTALPVALTVRLLPPVRAERLHGPAGWSAARTLMGLRWLPPLALGLGLVAAFSSRFDQLDVLGWSGVYVALVALVAVSVSFASALRLRRATA
jgi:hypothetical protein